MPCGHYMPRDQSEHAKLSIWMSSNSRSMENINKKGTQALCTFRKNNLGDFERKSRALDVDVAADLLRGL
jgi:hypothetical protein